MADRTRPRTLRLLPLAVAATLGVAGCGGSSGTITVRGEARPSGLSPAAGVTVESLQQAALRTSTATSGGFEMVMTVSGADGDVPGGMTMTMSGVYAEDRSRMSLRTEMSGLDELPEGLREMAGLLDVELITDGDVGYVRGGMFSMFSGQDAETWVRMPADEVASQSMASPLGADGVADLLSGAYGDVTEVGAEEVRGVATTRYRVLLDAAEAATHPLVAGGGAGVGAADELPLDVWVDDEGLVRRMDLTVGDPTGGAGGGDGATGTRVSMSMRTEFFDLGEPVSIEVPTDAVDVDEQAFGDSMLDQMEELLGGALDEAVDPTVNGAD